MPARPDAPPDPVALRRSIERALRRDEAPADVLPMLERLQGIAQEGSDERRYAERQLAELLLERDPWRAAVLVRRLVSAGGATDDANWALMGLAQALLGNHAFACTAYRRALSIDPGNPWYAHNLGHLLDVALDRPGEALKHLELAVKRAPHVLPIACSLVHARWRAGDLEGAQKALAPLLARGDGADPDVGALAVQLDREAARRRRIVRAEARDRPAVRGSRKKTPRS